LRPSQIEKNAKWVKKKAEDLIPGDVIKDFGFLISIDLNPDPDGFWGGKPNITYYDLNDSYYGPGSRTIDQTEFEVLVDRHDLIDAHNIVDSDLAKHIADLMEYRRNYSKIHSDFFNAYNREYRRKKNEKKNSKDV